MCVCVCVFHVTLYHICISRITILEYREANACVFLKCCDVFARSRIVMVCYCNELRACDALESLLEGIGFVNFADSIAKRWEVCRDAPCCLPMWLLRESKT